MVVGRSYESSFKGIKVIIEVQYSYDLEIRIEAIQIETE